MTSGAKTDQPGVAEKFWIDGTVFDMPTQYQVGAQLAQSIMATLAGTQIIRAAYRGDGLPDRADNYTFVIPYDIDDSNGALADLIEILRVTPGPHYFADWKQRPVFWTLQANKSFLYLPREDASQRAWLTVDGASFTPGWTGTAQTVVYKPNVSNSDAPAANEIWVSQATIQHPTSGRWVAPIKLGSPPGVASTLLGKYYMLFRVDVVDVVTDFGSRQAGTENKVLTLTEVVN